MATDLLITNKIRELRFFAEKIDQAKLSRNLVWCFTRAPKTTHVLFEKRKYSTNFRTWPLKSTEVLGTIAWKKFLNIDQQISW